MKQKLFSGKIAYFYFVCIGILFVFFSKTGRDLAEWGNILWTGSYTLQTLALSVGVGSVFGVLVCKGISMLSERKITHGKVEKNSIFMPISWGLITLAWLPAYLAYYPGICAYDFPIQLEQLTKMGYIDHHPIAHTWLIHFFMQVGEAIFDNTNTGIALFAGLQLLTLAGAIAFSINLLRKFGVRKPYVIAMQLVAMFFPFHWYLSISMTKDTIFTIFFLLQVDALLWILLEDKRALKWHMPEWLLLISSVGMILFRNNGKYAFCVLLVFLVLMLWRGRDARRLWGRLLLVCVAAFVVGNLLLSLFFRLADATQGDRREMLSIPIQQLARCMVYHGGIGVLPEDDGTMDEDAAEMINEFIREEAYRRYEPDFADPVKSYTNTSAALQQAGRFVKTYLQLLIKYPGDYINAVLAVDAGYLYLWDESHATINQKQYLPGKGYVQTRWVESELTPQGIYKDSKWEWLHEKLEQWADENAYLKLPLLKYLFMPGVYLWAYLVGAGVLLVRRKMRMLLPLSPVLGYYITMVLGPTVQLRYLYPVMVILPFALLLGNRFSKQVNFQEVREES